MVLFACWSSAFGLWWYIRNMALTGNPVHPFASSIFGYFLWDQSDMTDQFAGWISRIPRDITGFLAMPYYAHMDHILNYQGAFLTISVLYGSTILSSLTSRAQNSLLLFSWIFLASWVFGTQDPRHLMSIMPLVFVHAGCVLMAVYSRIVPEKMSSVVQIIFFIPTFSYFAIFVQQQFVRVFYTNVGESVQSTDSLMRQNDVYDIISHANEIFDEKSTVHEFYFRDVRLFFKGTLTGNQYGPHGYARLINESAKPQGGISPEKLEANLKQRYSAEGFIIPNPPNAPYNQEEFDAYFDLAYRNGAGSIYLFKTRN